MHERFLRSITRRTWTLRGNPGGDTRRSRRHEVTQPRDYFSSAFSPADDRFSAVSRETHTAASVPVKRVTRAFQGDTLVGQSGMIDDAKSGRKGI